MTHLFGSRRCVLILLAWLAVLGIAANVRAATEPAADSADDRAQSAEAALAPPTPPDDSTKYDLRYKLATGDVLRYEVTHRASIQSTIDETTQAAQTKTDSIKVWKVTDVLPSGEIEFMNVVERVSMVNQLPDRDPLEYDSARDKTPPPGFEDTAKAIGVPLSVMRMTPRGEVTRRDVKYGPLRAEDDAPIVVRLPDEPVAIGATWDEPFEIKVELQNGTTKPIQTRRHYKLADVSGDIATIEVTYQVLSPIDPPQEAQLVQRMMSGEVRFNVETGRVVGQQMDIDKRILGFAGPTSSMQYVMRMEEKLIAPPKKVAARPPATPPAPNASAVTKSPVTKAANQPAPSAPAKTAATQRRPTRRTRTASRPTPQATKGYRRY